MRIFRFWRILSCLWAIGLAGPAQAGEALIAASSNFSSALEHLEAAFERSSEHELKISLGSTGKLFAQIANGAPFDVFLSADSVRAKKLAETGAASEDNRFTYATGRLIFWYPSGTADAPAGKAIFEGRSLRKVAIAHPELAPYGTAGMETLKALGLERQLKGALAIGENIGQTFAFVASGNAEAGFVAASQMIGRNTAAETVWNVPAELHAPIRQDAVLLKRGQANPAARAFFEFLRSDQARAIIRAHGYEID